MLLPKLYLGRDQTSQRPYPMCISTPRLTEIRRKVRVDANQFLDEPFEVTRKVLAVTLVTLSTGEVLATKSGPPPDKGPPARWNLVPSPW